MPLQSPDSDLTYIWSYVPIVRLIIRSEVDVSVLFACVCLCVNQLGRPES